MRPIAISLSPNTQPKDILKSLRLLVSPWDYVKGKHIKLLEQWFRQSFGVSYAISFSSGRGAFLSILKALDIKEDDEVILQPFTCTVVPDAIIAVGAKPVYADIKDDLTIDVNDLENKITKNTKAILVQHTFGIPADLESIIKVAKKYKISVIEDCAHVVGSIYKGKKLGNYGSASFFSFGRDKAFSSVFGGMAITNDEKMGQKIRDFQKKQKDQNFLWVAQQLFHPIAFSIILPLYNVLYFGKIILVVLQKLRFLSFPVSSGEKKGKISESTIKKMPNALACLALFQLKRINEYNKKRKDISAYFLKELKDSKLVFPVKENIPFLRLPAFVENRDDILKKLKKKGIYLGKWYSNIMDPEGTEFKKIYYQRGSCPNAELIARKIINLPTYPLMRDYQVYEVTQLLKKYC